MTKNSKTLIIMTICIVAVIGLFSAISFYNYQNLPEVDVSESPLGIAWGTSKDEVESLMASQGYQKVEQEQETKQKIVYSISNYQNVEGVNGYAILLFDEALKFEEVIFDFRSSNTTNGLCADGKVDSFYKSLKKSLNIHYEKASYGSLEGYEYWVGDNIFATVIYEKSKSLTIDYTNNTSLVESMGEQEK